MLDELVTEQRSMSASHKPTGPGARGASTPPEVLVEVVDAERVAFFQALDPAARARLGQYGTPPAVARLMASMFEQPRETVRLLDAGAGVGSLTAAVVEELCGRPTRPQLIEATAVEFEAGLQAPLMRTLERCAAHCKRHGVGFVSTVVCEDFIEYVVSSESDLFSKRSLRFDCAIQNPPYKKIRSSSTHRKQLRELGIEVSNLYAAFVALTLRLLSEGGELVAITPRSFCNGPYFNSFRADFLSKMALKRLHVFDSRTEAFGGDSVLQENVIVHAGTTNGRTAPVQISSSSGEPGAPITQLEVPYTLVVPEGTKNAAIHVITDGTALRVTEQMCAITSNLTRNGLTVSTGRVVDFRAKQYLRPEPSPGDAPLIYPVHLRNGSTHWPKIGSRKANAIEVCKGTENLLVPEGVYVLIKRFSSKEQKRRIEAAIYKPGAVARGPVGFENHLNYIHDGGKGVDMNVARGLLVYLNSTLVDMHFRIFSGHTQVNATDLRNMPFPDAAALSSAGAKVARLDLTQDEVDDLFNNEFLGKSMASKDPVASQKRVQQAGAVLKALGFPKAQYNLRSSLVLLALLNLKRNIAWSKAGAPSLGTTEMMDWFAEHYGKKYAPNSRETVRRQTVHQFLDAGLVVRNPDDPGRPVNSGKNVYQIVPEALTALRKFDSDEWEKALSDYLSKAKTLKQLYSQSRKMERIPVTLDDGTTLSLSPGGQNVLVDKIIKEFVPRFAPGGRLIYCGDTEDKWAHFNETAFTDLGLDFDTHGKFPDVIVHRTKENWLLLIEAVASHGPVDPKRHRELIELFATSTAGLVFVTTFLTRKDLTKYLGEISWESEVWVADSPGHMIHFDGKRFLGPYDDGPTLDVVEAGRPWSFDGDGELLRLVSEAYRINLAWLFDPYVAITTSLIEPLPHQISAVYDELLPRQPMRFLLADDPGAGKTIMAGLFIKELKLRGDLSRCLIISPGSLTDQWQDELWEKFGLEFDLLSRDMIDASRSGNPFEHNSYLIARMDQLARSEELQDKLAAAPEWDLVIVDEAHRMSGHFFGNEIKLTKRYKLGLKIGSHCRNFLLMTATPHNGKEEDFQIFLALLDADRFEGKFRDGVHTAEPSDLMRRLVKEDLFRFDGKPLFPERCSYTVQYELSPAEAHLYAQVTEYVREEMNRAERFVDEGDGQRRVNVGFALMILQRRLASSPESIYRSLTRRREKLESRLREQRLLLRGQSAPVDFSDSVLEDIDEEVFDDAYDEAPQEEREELEAKLVDNATAAATIEELEIEIETLKGLQELARGVVRSGQDAKWTQLNSILDDPLMIDEKGHRRKLVIFSEFKDTLAYLGRRIRNRLGRDEAVVEIHGSVTREERRHVVHAFMNDPEVVVLIANDAAGEGVNLQRAHLMVNYDLPWNPNRLEQRFGRIHRIGQREVCHLWNLIAKDTREGDVYVRLLEKLEVEREALGGKVYDVLGRLFDQKALREMLMEAIRYGDDPEVKARLDRAVEGVVNRQHLQVLLDERALVHDSMDTSRIQAIRADMERAQARRLQPHFIQAFFLDAFNRLGGKVHRREDGRWEISHVPAALRERDRHIGQGAPVLKRYERVCFEKDKVDEQPRAELVCPGSPLLSATIDLVLERHSQLLKRGAVLVDEADPGETPRLLFYLEHSVQDGRRTRTGDLLTISKRMHFVEVGPDGEYQDAGTAPYLDYRPATDDERFLVDPELDANWLKKPWDDEVMGYAIANVVPRHVAEVRGQRLEQVEKTERQVKARLTKEISYWDRRAQDLKEKERAGKQTRLPAQVAQDRADKLADRLQTRLAALQSERHISPAPPRVTGGSLIIPGGMLRKLGGHAPSLSQIVDAAERQRVELLAMKAVFATERSLGRDPRDVSAQRGLGYDIESKDHATGELTFVEVKGRQAGASTITLTKNEILAAMNTGDRFRLVIVEIDGDVVKDPIYVQGFDFGQPGFAQTSATFDMSTLLQHGGGGARMSKVSFAATPLIAAQISLVEREDLKRSGQKKDAPVKERRAGNAIAGGVNESNNSRSQGSCQLLPSSAEGAK